MECMEAAAHPAGLSSKEARSRLRKLGPPEERSSRSRSSIIAGNVFTLFNLIIGVFFVVVLGFGLFADALFGFIAIINSYIGIRQELNAKETLDKLALLVAPRAKVIRDGQIEELHAEDVVPGDVIRVEPGDQLVADGEVAESRGLTLDESALTGEPDGIRKKPGQRALSGSFAISGSGYYEVDAVREDSYAERIAGEARAFRHPPSPLQLEVDQVLRYTTYLMIPLGIVLVAALYVRATPTHEAAQTATAGLITLIPEGLVLLMSVTLAVAAVRLAKAQTLVQQVSATESIGAVDTICVDKTGTLTSGELKLVGIEPADMANPGGAQEALARFAASAGEQNRTLQAIAESYPHRAEKVAAEVPFSSEWKWSGLTLGQNGGGGQSYVLGAPDVLEQAGVLALSPALQQRLEAHTSAGRRVVAFGAATAPLPGDPAKSPPPNLAPLALIVLEESLRPDTADTIDYMREQNMDLKVISGDAPSTVTAVARAIGIPADAGVITGDELPNDRRALARAARENTIFCRIRPEQKKLLVGALTESGRHTAMIGDGVNDVPALKRAKLAVAMGSGSQIAKGVADIVLLDDQFSRLPRAVGEGRRIARNIHRLGRLYLTKTVYAATLIATVGIMGWAFPFLPRHLTLAGFITIGIPSFVLALAPSDGPLYRGHLMRSLAAFAVPAGLAIAAGSLGSFFFVDTVFGGSLEAGRTAATTTLVILGLSFILLLERGPGREHIAIQSYMLAMVSALGALYALTLAVEPLRAFFDLTPLDGGQLFLAMLCSAGGLVLASAVWRLPVVENLEKPEPVEPLADALGKEAADRIKAERARAQEPPTRRMAGDAPPGPLPEVMPEPEPIPEFEDTETELPVVPPEPTQFEDLPPLPRKDTGPPREEDFRPAEEFADDALPPDDEYIPPTEEHPTRQIRDDER
jgi:cation-transporting ATPase E